jgi:ABC-type dipeptide/oligopeptide/nickel transport system permease component
MGLRAFVIRRILLLIPTLLGATLLIFAVSQLFSATTRAALYITNLQQFNAQNVQSVIEKYGLNDPAYLQFFRWLQEVLRGNLGWSQTARAPVTEALLSKFPATAEIVTIVAPLVIFIGIYLGVQSAVHRDKPVDHITRATSITGMSLPSFWLGIILISIFGVNLGWLPTGARLSVQGNDFVNTSQYFIKYTGLMWIDGILNGQLWITVDALKHLILPVIVLVTIQTAGIVRIMRSSMLEALNKGYITAARAKGLSQNEVINKHARRNALIPTVTLSGMMVAGMLNGLVITETVFGFGGLGQWSAQSALRLDIAAVLGFTMFAGFLFVIANLFVDILYAYLDPRIRLG